MSEDSILTAASVEPSSEQVDSVTAGGRLRLAREAAGLHIAALAVSLKVPVKKLEALESDRIDLLPDAVFARALASSVCRTLKIDAGPVLAGLPQTALPRLMPDSLEGKDSFRTPSLGSKRSVWEAVSKPFVLAGLVLIMAAVAVAVYPVKDKSLPVFADPPAGFSGAEVKLPTTSSPEVAVPIEKPMTVAGPLPPESPAPLATTPTPVLPVAVPEVKNEVSAAPRPVSSAPASVPGIPATTGLLVLKTRGTSWVEVTDAGGIVQLRRTMVDGEVIGVSGGLPLSVIVGKADTTEVQIRGKTFDLAPLTKDNVARFEVR